MKYFVVESDFNVVLSVLLTVGFVTKFGFEAIFFQSCLLRSLDLFSDTLIILAYFIGCVGQAISRQIAEKIATNDLCEQMFEPE